MKRKGKKGHCTYYPDSTSKPSDPTQFSSLDILILFIIHFPSLVAHSHFDYVTMFNLHYQSTLNIPPLYQLIVSFSNHDGKGQGKRHCKNNSRSFKLCN